MQFNGIFYNLCGNCFAEFDGILQLEPKDQETVFELAKHLDKYKDAVDIVEYLRAKKALGEDRVQ